jgi:Zn finger protein HypA/HybF involved in hydrogenase expression
MNSKESKVLEKAIHELDTACGMLLVMAMRDKTVKEAMEKVKSVSVKIGMLFE